MFDKFYCVGKIFNVYLLQNVLKKHKSMQTIRNEAMHIIVYHYLCYFSFQNVIIDKFVTHSNELSFFLQ